MKRFKKYEAPLIDVEKFSLGHDFLMMSVGDNLETIFDYDNTDWL